MNMLFTEAAALWRARALCLVLTRREISARYAGTALGVAWAYVQPLLTIAAYYLVFDVVFAMRLGDGAPTRAVGAYLIVGMLPWMAFCDALMRGMASLVEAGSVLQKNALPPVLFPVRAVLASQVVYAPLLVVLVLAYAPWHGGAAALVLLPLVFLLMFVVMVLLSIAPTLAFRRWRRTLRATAALPPDSEVRKARRLVMVQSHILPVVAVIAVFWARGW